jgi:hypothetical protein
MAPKRQLEQAQELHCIWLLYRVAAAVAGRHQMQGIDAEAPFHASSAFDNQVRRALQLQGPHSTG